MRKRTASASSCRIHVHRRTSKKSDLPHSPQLQGPARQARRVRGRAQLLWWAGASRFISKARSCVWREERRRLSVLSTVHQDRVPSAVRCAEVPCRLRHRMATPRVVSTRPLTAPPFCRVDSLRCISVEEEDALRSAGLHLHHREEGVAHLRPAMAVRGDIRVGVLLLAQESIVGSPTCRRSADHASFFCRTDGCSSRLFPDGDGSPFSDACAAKAAARESGRAACAWWAENQSWRAK
jgi:hypothetical protein